MLKEETKGLVLYQTEDGAVTLEVNVEEDTVWLTQMQMADLFQRDISVISRHIKNVFQEEVEEKSNLHFLQIASSDKPVACYSLDVIISVGYRVKSKRGVEFRRWANQVLKDYIIRGCAVNQGRMDQLGGIIRIMKRVDECLDTRQVLQVIESYASALDLLDDYDHQRIQKPEGSDKNGILFDDGNKRIDDYALAAITIMIAESRPEEKELMVNLVMKCLV